MTHIALLRGINVAGRSVPMADLKRLCEGLGWSNLRTYIQSGNVIFDAEIGEPQSRQLEKILEERFSFPIPVMIRTADQWRTLAADRPFDGWTHLKQLSVSLLDHEPDPAVWQALSPWREADDEIALIGDRVWVKTPGGYGETKFHNAFLEKKLGCRATTRNRATVEALLAMLTFG